MSTVAAPYPASTGSKRQAARAFSRKGARTGLLSCGSVVAPAGKGAVIRQSCSARAGPGFRSTRRMPAIIYLVRRPDSDFRGRPIDPGF
jgi:hypothetical protein